MVGSFAKWHLKPLVVFCDDFNDTGAYISLWSRLFLQCLTFKLKIYQNYTANDVLWQNIMYPAIRFYTVKPLAKISKWFF